MLLRLWTFVVLATVTASASAQVRLPSLAPALPLQTPLLQSLSPLDPGDSRNLDRIEGLRRAVVGKLIRANRHVIEADPHGEPIVIGDVLALNPAPDALDKAKAAGFIVARDVAARENTALSANLRVVVLRARAGMATTRALNVLRASDPTGIYDYNHIYTQGGEAQGGHVQGDPVAQPTREATVPPSAAPGQPAAPHIRIGLLDTGVDATHAVFRDTVVHRWGCGENPVPNLHGTAVASLLMAHANAEIYAADVYCGQPTGGALDVIIDALLWMTTEHVAVINVSLVGPKNVLLERTVAALVEHGYLVVAAVGNDGPSAAPLYPAAYDHVVGVTGVDAKHRVLIEALRGPQVTFAALGADIKAADLAHAFTEVRGTSFAAPTVAALLAQTLRTPDPAAAAAAVESLAAQAIDLGAPGKDLTYGYGLVGVEPLTK